MALSVARVCRVDAWAYGVSGLATVFCAFFEEDLLLILLS